MPVPPTVEAFIDWSRRPFRVEDADGPSIGIQAAPGMTGGNWSIVQRFPGEILTADKYNADRQIVVDNAVPLMIDDYSATVAQMQAATDPFPGGAPSLAVSLAGEIERLRFVLQSLNPDGHWYEVPTNGIHPAGGFKLGNNEALLGERSDGSYGELIKMGTDDQIAIGADLPAGKYVILGNDTSGGAWIPGRLQVLKGASIRGVLTLEKGQWLHWDDIPGIAVGVDNVLYIAGTGVPHIMMQRYTSIPGGADINGLTVNGALEVNAGVHVDGNLAVDNQISLNGALIMKKDQWQYWGDIYAMTVATSNNWIYIGGNAAGVNLRNTNIGGDLQVFGNQYTSGSLTVGGPLTASTIVTGGGNGNGVIDGINAVRAWCRWVGGFAGQYGFAGGGAIGVTGEGALYRFTLARAYPGGYAVSVAIEGGAGVNAIGRVIPRDAQTFDVAIMNVEDNPIGANFQLIVAGQL